MKKRNIAIILLIGILIIRYVLIHYNSNEYSINQLDDYVEKMCEISDTPGMSIAIYENGQEKYINVGYADKQTREKATNQTRYELGSTTKAFTGLCILLLEQEGILNRDDLIRKYLEWFTPTYNGEIADITIEHLLCHTSGIPVWTVAGLPIGTNKDDGLLEKTVRTIQSVKLDHVPGTVHSYATINYDVLALIIEKVTGVTYEEYVKENILDPLAMTDSYLRVDDSKTNKLAQGYHYAFLDARKQDAPTFYGNTAAGYMVTSTKDLMIWMKAQLGIYEGDMTDSLTKLSTAIQESHSYPIKEGQNYFAGWNLYDTYYCHGGNNPNFCSQVILGPEQKKGVFVLANISGSAATMTADGIYRMLYGEKIKIGLWIDGYSFIDFISMIVCIIELYIGIYLIEKRNKQRRYARVKTIIALILTIVVAVFPHFWRYNYITFWVWCSPCLLLAIAGCGLCLIGYFISCIRVYMQNKKRL